MHKGVLLILLFSTLLFAQTNVDRLVSQLDSLTVYSVTGWRFTTDFESGDNSFQKIAAPGYDASHWQPLDFNQRLYVDSCWLRAELTVPSQICGKKVEGTLKFLVSVDDYGFLWVNGEEKGKFPWDGEFDLSQDAQPGEKYVLLIKAMNTGGPLRLLRANIEPVSLQPLLSSVKNLTTSLRVGQKLLGFDTYQTNARVKVDPGIDKSHMDAGRKKQLNQLLQNAALEVDVDALRDGQPEKFSASVEKILPSLKKVNDFVRQYSLVFASNAHIDAAWLWRKAETKEVCKNTFSSVFNIMNRYPDFTYTQSSACYYEWMQTLYPQVFENIRKRVKDGRWEVIGGMWIEPDCNLPDGVSWARQLLYAQKYFQKNFGKLVKIGWNPDSFGYNWNMPQFYLNAGIDAFITQKIGWNDTNVFPYRVFWWEGPDSSRILSYFPFDYVNTVSDPFRLVDWMRQFDANTGFTKMLVLFGVGDHGGGPSMEMLDRIDALRNLYIYPSIEFETAGKYLDWLKSQDLSDLPVWDDELYLEYHRGTLTTQAQMKKSNRQMETLLTNTEKFATIAGQFGREYPQQNLQEAWRKVMFNQFHDILPGSSIREVYFDAREDYKKSREIGEFELGQSLQAIAKNINTNAVKKGKPLVVFNPLSWQRSDVVRYSLEKGDDQDYAVFDADGNEIPSQVVQTGKFEREILFIAGDVPPIGYKVYELRAQPPKTQGSDLRISENTLENKFFLVIADSETGWIKSILDKTTGKEVLSGPGNELQLFEDRPSAWDAWNIGLMGRYQTKFRGIEVVENGPVRAVLRVKHDFLNPHVTKDFPTEDFPTSFFTQDIILYCNTPRVDFKTDVDWWEEHTMLKVAFPVAVNAETATYEIPDATIQRPTNLTKTADKGKWEVAALRWADLSKDDYGVSLINNSKYGYDIKGNVMRLSLLRSPTWPDPTADRGKHSISYSLFPHGGNWETAGTVEKGYAFNNPLIAIAAETHKGKLPLTNSFVCLAPSRLVLTTIKQAEDGPGAWILQWYESSGVDTTARLTLPFEPQKVYSSNFLEEELKPVQFNKNEITINTGKNKIVTLKLYPK